MAAHTIPDPQKIPLKTVVNGQSVQDGSTAYVTLAAWIIRLLHELRIPFDGPLQIWCDNKSSIEMTRNPVYHDRTKHVEIDRHYIKEKVEAGIMTLTYVRSSEQIGDMMTKPLDRPLFERFRSKLGMIDIYSPA